ncbi:MAG: flagellin [Pirellulales bacterium]|nr:flagellin [Pirellulales bacterium]
MTRINTNVSSLIAQKNLARSNDQLQEALTRLSTGLRINTGKDDPAGLIASEVLRSDITSTQKAITNNERANQIISTADSALGQVSSLLNDIRGLVSEAANTGALSAEQIAANQLQVDSSLDSIDRIARVTSFQGRRLLDGSLDFITTSPGTIETTAAALFGTTANANAATTVTANVGGTTGGDIRFTAIGSAAAAGNGITVNFIDGARGGAVTATKVGNSLTFVINSGTTTANQILTALSASSLTTAVSGALINGSTGSGTFAGGTGFTDATATAGTALAITAKGYAGTSGNGITVSFAHTGTAGVTLVGSSLVFTIDSGVTTASNLISVLQSSSLSASFTAAIAGGSSGGVTLGSAFQDDTFGGGVNGATTAGVTSGGVNGNQIQLSATTAGATLNGVTVRLQTGGSAGAEIASYNGTSKTLTVTIQDGVSTAAQIATAITSQGLFSASVASGSNGLGAYGSGAAALTTTALTVGGTSNVNLQDINIDQANFGTLSQIGVEVLIDQQAKKAKLIYSAQTLTNSLNLEIGGKNGFQVFNLGGGTTIQQMSTAINLVSDATGVEATVVGTNLELTSTEYGSKAFVQARALNTTLGGSFITSDSAGTQTTRTAGQDVRARINGVQATGDGLRASINTATLTMNFNVAKDLSDGASLSFNITGGGANFQLGPDVVSNQQARLGIQGVSTATIGGVNGTLFQLRSGNSKALSTDATAAAAVVDEVISKITQLRGRLGAFQRTTLQSNIQTLNDTISNLSDAEATIRDADYAAESAKLTRAQILVQSGTAVLGIANTRPQQVLQLLRGI